MKDLISSQKGQTLLEILLAFGASILVLSAIVLGITTSLSNTQYTKNQGLATDYAQEGISVVRKIRDSSWGKFFSYSTNTTYCIGKGETELTSSSAPPIPCGMNVGIFSREVKFEHNSDFCTDKSCTGVMGPCVEKKGSKATVKVSWSDNKCPASESSDPLCHDVELISCFSNLDLKPTP